jgi:tetratricopeptide (TPR) repeat protein
LAGVACLSVITAALAGEPPVAETVAHKAYEEAKAAFNRGQDDAGAAWQFARACFDWAEFSTNHTQRAALAQEGIAACENTLEGHPDLAAAHYYLGMNQGQLARTMSLGALRLVHEMEAHFQRARELDPHFDKAGPDRNLGLLYLEAPGWPVSVGNRSKARAHLTKAVKLAPHYPENRLNLMEAYAQWNEKASVERELKAWDDHVATARKEFPGHRWHWSWLDWERRIETLKQLVADAAPVLRSPKDRR